MVYQLGAHRFAASQFLDSRTTPSSAVRFATISSAAADDGRQVVLKFFRDHAKWRTEAAILALLSADGDPTVDSGSGKTDEDDDDDDAAGSLPAFPAPEFADAVVVVAAVVADAAAVAAGGR